MATRRKPGAALMTSAPAPPFSASVSVRPGSNTLHNIRGKFRHLLFRSCCGFGTRKLQVILDNGLALDMLIDTQGKEG